MKISKLSKTWLLILLAGLVSGAIGTIEEGWNIGASIGLVVWLILAGCVALVIRRENQNRVR